jgi:hypothetical protein
MTFVPSQLGSASVRDATYLGNVFNARAISLPESVTMGEVLEDDKWSHAWKNAIRTGAIASAATSWP